MKLKIFITGILILFTCRLFSQHTLSGSVYDSINKQQLIGAAVYIQEMKKGTISGVDGDYSFRLSEGKYTIKISFLGYKNIEEQIVIKDNDIQKDFYLRPTSEIVDEIIVQGKSMVQTKREQPFQVSILDAKPLQIQSKPVTALVGQISGVRIRENGGMGSNIKIMLNGIGGKGVKIFVDDIPADLLGNGVAINVLPVNMINHIEVYKGFIPAKFGSDALGGIINLVTRDIKRDFLDVSIGIGSFGTCQAGLNSRKYLGNEKKYYLELNGFYSHSDNDYWMDDVEILTDKLGNTETGSVKRFNDAFTSYMGRFIAGAKKLSWADEIQLNLTAANIYNEVQHGKSSEQAYGEVFWKEDDLNSELKWKKSRMFNKKLDATLNAGYSYIERTFIDTASKAYYWGATDGLANYVESQPGETGYYVDGRNPVIYRKNSFARLNLVYHLYENHELNFTTLYTGVNITGHDERGITTFGSDIFANPQTLYKKYFGLALESKFWDDRITNILMVKNFSGNSDVVVIKETLVAEGNVQDTYFDWSYGDALKIQLLPGFMAILNYEHTIRLPDEEELFGDFVFIYPNSELEPEKSQNVGIGARYKTRGGKLSLNINGFYHYTSNLIFLNSLSLFRCVYMNLLTTNTFGAEGEINYRPINDLALYANFTWQDIRLKQIDSNSDINERYIGSHIPNTPWLFGNLGANYSLPWHIYKIDKIQVYYTFNYVHEFYLTWEVDGLKSTKERIPRQIVHNAGISYAFYKDRLSLSFESRNFTNEKIYDNYKVQKPGRSFYLKLRYYIDD